MFYYIRPFDHLPLLIIRLAPRSSPKHGFQAPSKDFKPHAWISSPMHGLANAC